MSPDTLFFVGCVLGGAGFFAAALALFWKAGS